MKQIDFIPLEELNCLSLLAETSLPTRNGKGKKKEEEQSKALHSGKSQKQHKKQNTDERRKKKVVVDGEAMCGMVKEVSRSLYASDKRQEGLLFRWSEWSISLWGCIQTSDATAFPTCSHQSLQVSSLSADWSLWPTTQLYIRGTPLSLCSCAVSFTFNAFRSQHEGGTWHASGFVEPLQQTKVAKEWNFTNLLPDWTLSGRYFISAWILLWRQKHFLTQYTFKNN